MRSPIPMSWRRASSPPPSCRKTWWSSSSSQRTDLTNGKIGTPQRDTILAAGLALQQAGVIKPGVDVKGALDALIDDHYVVAVK